MGDDDEAGTDGPVELQHQIDHALRRVTVQVARGLVAQHAGGPRDQSAGERGSLALSLDHYNVFLRQAGPERAALLAEVQQRVRAIEPRLQGATN